jgi:hypothetical protein
MNARQPSTGSFRSAGGLDLNGNIEMPILQVD